MIRKILTSCFIIVYTVSFGLAAGPVPVLGQVIAANNVQMDGMSVPSGTTVLDKTVVRTTQDPASIHLTKGQLIQLHRNSSAYFEKTSSEVVRVSVRSGTLSYRSASGKVVTVPPESVIVFVQDTVPGADPGQEGLRVVLVKRAEAGQDTIQVNDAARIDPNLAILLRSPDSETQEVHYVEAFDGNNVKLTAPLENTFEANTQLIQDPQVLEQALAAGAAVVGATAGISIGAAAAGAAVGA
ncbi:hypothetical protein MYX82_00005, partial [Acidobacteria bacterium AH-259-D05]|nr:hypothetical protein [Acidobacteria bacterium AH-259-D05]